MLNRIAGNGVRTILVESPDRFARDLAVQLAGHDHLRSLGVTLIPTSSPDFFIEDTPTAVLVRQVLGAIAQFEKATTVAKLRPRVSASVRRSEMSRAERAGRSSIRSWWLRQSASAADRQRGISARYVRSPTSSRNWA
ncbi:recombinase family protein, partial [Dietzia sp. PP-33]|uniref:recombinase family protein n=1 Tax=Dietzia sp. PP-33 TaxID=2957500 RepID=UPI0039B0AE84